MSDAGHGAGSPPEPSFHVQHRTVVPNNQKQSGGLGGADSNYIKFVTTSLAQAARAAKSLWQQCNLRIQTNGGRSAHMWLHLGARVAVSRPFVIYFHKELAR